MLSQVSVCPQGGSRSLSGGLCLGGSLSKGIYVQGDLCPRGSLSKGISVQGGLCPGASLSRGGSLCPEEGVSVQGVSGGSLSRGVSVWASLFGGSLSWRPPCGNEGAVCILLECILVLKFKLYHT